MRYFRYRDRFTILAARGVFAIALLSGASILQAQTFTVLHSFGLSSNDGAYPTASIIRDSKGNLYGTANGGAFGYGAVFKVSASGGETVLHSFNGQSDGDVPDSLSLLDAYATDMLVGTTYQGGANNFGTVFQLDNNGNETVLYDFCANACSSDAYPGQVLGDPLTDLYGITYAGGNFGYCAPTGCGAFFKLDKNGVQTILHSFGGAGDAGRPNAGIIRDATGNFYGTASFGGAYGYGAVFEVDSVGNEHVIYSFTGGSDGSEPMAGLSLDRSGNLYGTTSLGGASNLGTVFRVTPGGQYTVLYSFKGGADGANPYAGVVRDQQGNLFGTTHAGGAQNVGTIFKLDTSGNETVLHSFEMAKDGGYPYGLVSDPAANLYGTTYRGGAYRFGTVFKLVP
jgi:uncharacterized repeat protein (TIGR03803 family)